MIVKILSEKKLSLILCLCVLVSALFFTACESGLDEKIASYGDAFCLVVSDESGKPGDTVTVEVHLANNPGFYGMSFCLNFDSDSLAVLSEELLIEDDTYTIISDETDGNGINFAWTALSPYTENGLLCTLKLRIADDAASGSYPISVVFRPSLDSFYTMSGDELPDLEISAADGSVTVK